MLVAVPGNAADNNATRPAGSGVTDSVSRVQDASHQHPDWLLRHQHGNGEGVCQRPDTAPRRGGKGQGQVPGRYLLLTL